MESSSVEKLMEIDRNIGCAMSGLTADARTWLAMHVLSAKIIFSWHDEPLKVSSCTSCL